MDEYIADTFNDKSEKSQSVLGYPLNQGIILPEISNGQTVTVTNMGDGPITSYITCAKPKFTTDTIIVTKEQYLNWKETWFKEGFKEGWNAKSKYV